MNNSEEEAEECSSFQMLLQKRLQKGLVPTKMKVVQVDGSVQFLEKQGSLTCNSENEKQLGFVVDTKPDLTLSCVLPNWLYLSSQDVPNDLNLIETEKITHILSLLPDFELIPEVKSKIVEHLCLNYYDEVKFSITDNIVLGPALDFIRKVKSISTGKVIVHCNAGLSRSPTVVILYLMKYEQLSLDEAYKLAKCARPHIKPNIGFLNQLKQYEIK